MNTDFWLDIIKMLTPIFAVIIASLFALYRMKQNIKLEDKLKWKSELRSEFVDLIDLMTQYEDFLTGFNIERLELVSKGEKYNSEKFKQIEKVHIDYTKKLKTSSFKIGLYLNSENSLYERFYKAMNDYFDSIKTISSEEGEIPSSSIPSYYELEKIAKKILT